jgi:hypothetical protein
MVGCPSRSRSRSRFHNLMISRSFRASMHSTRMTTQCERTRTDLKPLIGAPHDGTPQRLSSGVPRRSHTVLEQSADVDLGGRQLTGAQRTCSPVGLTRNRCRERTSSPRFGQGACMEYRGTSLRASDVLRCPPTLPIDGSASLVSRMLCRQTLCYCQDARCRRTPALSNRQTPVASR